MAHGANRDRGWLSWRWVAGGLLGAVAVGGLFVARAAQAEAVYVLGLALTCAAAVSVYGLIATAYGPSPFDGLGGIEPLPPNGTVRWAAGGIAGALGLGALFYASARTGLAYGAGLGLFAAAVLYDFLLIKDWFDRAGRRRRP